MYIYVFWLSTEHSEDGGGEFDSVRFLSKIPPFPVFGKSILYTLVKDESCFAFVRFRVPAGRQVDFSVRGKRESGVLNKMT